MQGEISKKAQRKAPRAPGEEGVETENEKPAANPVPEPGVFYVDD